jgi:hypothetical protein
MSFDFFKIDPEAQARNRKMNAMFTAGRETAPSVPPDAEQLARALDDLDRAERAGGGGSLEHGIVTWTQECVGAPGLASERQRH